MWSVRVKRGRLAGQLPGVVKYKILVYVVCEATTGCICNMEISTEGKKLEEAIVRN
jgi:hypothetical protein